MTITETYSIFKVHLDRGNSSDTLKADYWESSDHNGFITKLNLQLQCLEAQNCIFVKFSEITR